MLRLGRLIAWAAVVSRRSAEVVFNPPVIVSLPVISGDLHVNGVPVTSDGVWTNDPSGYLYQWLSDGTAIDLATTNSYSVTEDDIGAVISVTVTALNADGETEATS